MLSIRMQRKGRTGHAQFRVIVQDSHFHPSSGRVVAYVGSYDPHTKAAKLDDERISAYLANGAQPSDRVAKLLTKEGIKLPDWFTPAAPKSGTIRNANKRRSTRPEGITAPSPAQTLPDKVSAGEPKAEMIEEPAATEPPAEEPAPAPTSEESEPRTPDAPDRGVGAEPAPEPEPATPAK